VWEDRANRLARARRREQRQEQRKNIEDRWRKHAVKSSSLEKRDHRQGASGGDHDGYQSEGQAQARHDEHRDRSDGYRVADGYQSEGPSQRRSHGQVVRGDYHDGYQSEGQEEGQEIEYDDMLENVDSAPITVQDARRRLWDREERLRAVLPEIGSGEMGDVRGRWLDERQPPAGSPSNYSGSSGGLFKSKFVHAAALATRDRVDREQQQQQQRANVIEEGKDQEQEKQERNYEEQRSRWSQAQRTITSEEEETRERAQQRRFEERQNPRKAQQRQQQQLQNPRQAKHSQQQQQNKEFNSKKIFLHKTEMAASSHYTDSTAETTAVTTPGGSYGSTHLRKVSLSPPKRPAPQQSTASSAMPPIAEQQAAPPPMLQKQQPSSVADLIARINAVRRSNPEEALAAIDSILKKEGGGGVRDRFVCGDIERVNTPQDALPGTTPSPAAPPPLPPTKTNPRSLFSPSRPEVAPPKISTKRANNVSGHVAAAPVRKQLGKDLFQQSYEEVLRADSERVIRGSALERDREGDDDDVDEGSSMSTSEDSTVSSMTNPTYQSLRSERKSLNNTTELPKNIRRKNQQRSEHGMQATKMFINPAQTSHLQRNSQQPYQQDLPSKPQKSWNTLRKEYTQRKVSSPAAAQQGNVTTARTPSNDIGVEEFEFNPDDIEVDLGQKNSIEQQPQTVSKTASNDFVTTGFCGMNYRMAQSGSESKGFGDDYDHDAPPTPSTLTDSAWIPMPTKGNAFSEGRKNNKQRPFTGNGKNNGNRLDMPALTAQQKNIKAASSQQKRNNQSGSNVVTKQLSNTTAQPSHNVNVTRHIQPSGNNLLKKRSTRPTTPDIMKAVSDAFSDVDISLEEGRNNMEEHAQRLIQKTRARPMIDCDDVPQSSLQTISETISNVDVSFDEEKKTVGQRRKELEYLANNWTNSKSPSPHVGSKSDTGVGGGSSSFAASLAKVIKRDDAGGGGGGGGSTIGSSSWTQPRSLTKAATWANEPQKSTARGVTTVNTKYKKVGEPAMRLKGNKSLAKKFASLVKAYDD